MKGFPFPSTSLSLSLSHTIRQRLAGASLLVFANKHDIQGSVSADEIREVSYSTMPGRFVIAQRSSGPRLAIHQVAPLEDPVMQCHHRRESG